MEKYELPKSFDFYCKLDPYVIYHASELNSYDFKIDWFSPRRGTNETINYKKETMVDFLKNGAWIMTEGTDSSLDDSEINSIL